MNSNCPIPTRFFRIAPILLLAVLLAGCGGGGGGSTTSTGNGGNADRPNAEGTIVLESVLARAVPASITHFRISGFDSQQSLTYGPRIAPKATRVEFENVPITTRTVKLEYLQDSVVRGVWTGSVSVSVGQTTLITNPAFLDVESQLVSIEISPPQPRVAAGLSLQLRATGVFDDNSRLDLTESVSWSVEGESAQVSDSPQSKGLLTGLSNGEVRVRARLNSASAQVNVLVTTAQVVSVKVSIPSNTLPLGAALQATALSQLSDGSEVDSSGQVSWSSSNPSVASVSSNGIIQAEKIGTAEIRASIQGKSDSLEVTVTDAVLSSLEVIPASVSVPLGLSEELQVLAHFSDSTSIYVTSFVTWDVVDPNVAEIVSNKIETKSIGNTVLTANYGGISRTVDLEVTPAVPTDLRLTFHLPQLPAGTSEALKATSLFSDGVDRDVTSEVVWQVEPADLAVVSNSLGFEGVITGIQPGVARVQGLLGALSAELQLTVGEPVIFVNNQAPENGTGSFSRPFSTLLAGVTAAGEDTTIFVMRGDGTSGGYSEPTQLKSGQRLRGQALGYPLLNIPSSEAPLLGSTVNLADDSALEGVEFHTVPGEAAVKAESVQNLVIKEVTITQPSLHGISLQEVEGTVSITDCRITLANSMSSAVRFDTATTDPKVLDVTIAQCDFVGVLGDPGEPLVRLRPSLSLPGEPGGGSLRIEDNTFSDHGAAAVEFTSVNNHWTSVFFNDNNCSAVKYGFRTFNFANSDIERFECDRNIGGATSYFLGLVSNGAGHVSIGTYSGNQVGGVPFQINLEKGYDFTISGNTFNGNNATFSGSGTSDDQLLTVRENVFNQGSTTTLGFSTSGLVNFKDNQFSDRAGLSVSGDSGIDLSGNTADTFFLSALGYVEVEQLSSLNAVNSFNTLAVQGSANYVEVPDGALGLP